jgi:hypothetical protein
VPRWQPFRLAWPEARLDVHVHRDDPSRRCFHLAAGALAERGTRIALRVRAESGSDRVGYTGHVAPLDVEEPAPGRWTAAGELDADRLRAPTVRLRIRLDRTPLPVDGPSRLVAFPPSGVRSRS